MRAAGIHFDADQLPLVELEAFPDLCHHLRIELELLIAQYVVAQLVVLHPPVVLLGVEDAHAPVAGDVLTGRRC